MKTKSETKKIVVVCGKDKHVVTVSPKDKGKIILLFKLGNEKRGWIPSKAHFDMFNDLLETALRSSKSPTSIVFHYGVKVEKIKI